MSHGHSIQSRRKLSLKTCWVSILVRQEANILALPVILYFIFYYFWDK